MKKSISSLSTSSVSGSLLAGKKKVKKVAKKNPPSQTTNTASKKNLPLKKSGQLFFLVLALALLFAVAWRLKGGLNLTKPSQSDPPSTEEIESYDIYEVEAEILEQEATLYNDYFAFSYTLPPSYAVYEWWETNLAKKPGETGRLSQFEFTNEDGERDSESSPNSEQKFISFIAYGNKRYSQLEDHFDVIVDAIKIAGADNQETFLDLYEKNLIFGQKLAEDYLLEKKTPLQFAGRDWAQRLYQSVGDERPIYLLRLATPLKNGYFLVMQSTYWASNPQAYEQVLAHFAQSIQFSE